MRLSENTTKWMVLQMSKKQWGNGYYKGIKDGIHLQENFKSYCIALFDDDDSPEGDFANDVKWDSLFPSKNNLTEQELISYLRHRGACSEAIQIGKKLFLNWKKQKINKL